MTGTSYPLTCAQQWLLSAYATTRMAPQIRWYEPTSYFAAQDVATALAAVASATPALRLALAEADGGWHQVEDDRPIAVDRIVPPHGDQASVLGWARDELRRTRPDRVADEDHHPSIAAVLIGDGDRPPLLALLADRFATDGRGFDALERLLDAALDNPGGAVPCVAPEDVPGLIAPADFRADDALVEPIAAKLAEATSARQEDPEPDVYAAHRDVRTRSGAEATALLHACKAAGISPVMAFAAAQALVLADGLRADQVVLNLPVSNRRPGQRDLVANLSTVAHVPIDLQNVDRVGALRHRVRSAILAAIQHRTVDPSALYLRLFRALPSWPPGWNAFCNVRDGLRWDEQRVLVPVDEGGAGPDDALPGLLTANARVSPKGSSTEWLWDTRRFALDDARPLEALVDAVAAAPDDAPLGDLREFGRLPTP